MKKFFEAMPSVLDNALSAWLTPDTVAAAKEVYAPLEKTRDGQLKILNDAQSGKELAVVYLYDQYMPLIQKVFWKYFIGPNKEYGKGKLQPEAVFDFVSVAYEMLAGHSTPSPYKTFNPAKFDDKTNIVKQFSYYAFRYLQNDAIHLAKAMTRGGMAQAKLNSDDSDEEKVTVTSYEDYLDNSTETASEDHAEISTLRIMLDNFRDWLKENKDEKFLTVWDMKSQGCSMQDIADELGLPMEQYARALWNKVKTWFIEQNPTAKEFLN